jgi:NAD(P)-dependent dehydrogenase (short-subunit alcohol dehydrogenase family)
MLQGKVALVTGSGRGIGRAIAIMMASRGASVVVNDVGAGLHGEKTGETPAEEVVEAIEKAGGQAVANYDSVCDWDGAHRMVQQAVDSFGRIDIVVNNAGILRDGMFHKMTAEDFDAVVQVHLFGALYVSRAAAPLFRQQESGCFIHMTSGSGLFGNVGQVNYAAAKMGIIGLSNSLTLELMKFNVRSNVISPAGHTRMTDSVPLNDGNREFRLRRAAATPPEAPATLATLLASDHAKGVNGQIIGARGTEVFLYSHPRPVRFLHHKGGWTPEQLLASLPKLEPLFTPVTPARDFMPWTPD